MTLKQVRAAVAALPPSQDFVWDGDNEDERPATAEELQTAIASANRKRGRPVGSGTREQVSVRYSHDVIASFRATGTGWQTRMDTALRDWLKTHDPSEIKLG
jgi:uncharacterized protein (DUF4415 family)